MLKILLHLVFASVGVTLEAGNNVGRRRLGILSYDPPNCMDAKYIGETCVALCDGNDACKDTNFDLVNDNLRNFIIRCTDKKYGENSCKGNEFKVSFGSKNAPDVYVMCLSGECPHFDELPKHIEYVYCKTCKDNANRRVLGLRTYIVNQENKVEVVVFDNKVAVAADPNNNIIVGVLEDSTAGKCACSIFFPTIDSDMDIDEHRG